MPFFELVRLADIVNWFGSEENLSISLECKVQAHQTVQPQSSQQHVITIHWLHIHFVFSRAAHTLLLGDRLRVLCVPDLRQNMLFNSSNHKWMLPSALVRVYCSYFHALNVSMPPFWCSLWKTFMYLQSSNWPYLLFSPQVGNLTVKLISGWTKYLSFRNSNAFVLNRRVSVELERY